MTAHVALAVRPKSAKSTMSSRIPRPLPLEGVVPDEGGGWTTTAVSRDLDEDCQFLQASPVPKSHGQSRGHFHPAKAKRSLIFEPSPNYHHYYDILDDTLLLRGDGGGGGAGKRERSSEEDETASAAGAAADPQRRDATGKAKQVKKRVKRIEQRNSGAAEIRRSLELQEMLKATNYQRPRRGAAAECLAAATPCVVKARKSYRRPQQQPHGARAARQHSSSTYLGVEQPEPEEEEEEEAEVGVVVSESAPGSPEAGTFRRGGSCRSANSVLLGTDLWRKGSKRECQISCFHV